ncbi:phosphoribosyltransferase family protein [Nocardia vulneris]|uniref:phosphoribosyltransferase n=1 Tax=Nocardia vulneris TaxID=1141657 RepID=UPI0030CA9F87
MVKQELSDTAGGNLDLLPRGVKPELDWPAVQELVQRLGRICRAQIGDADAIVGISRGGWIPARLLAEHLGIKRLYSMGLQYSDSKRTTLETYQFPHIENSRVILIEDATESGRALDYGRKVLEPKNNFVLTASLLVKKGGPFPSQAFCDEVDVVPRFPWEI